MSDSVAPSEVLARAAALLERGRADRDVELGTADLQRLMAAAVRFFVAELERGARVTPFPPAGVGEPPTATEVMVAATEFLAASEIELFELGMWQTWGGVGAGSARSTTGDTSDL